MQKSAATLHAAVQATLQRVAQLNPHFNAIVNGADEAALLAAKAHVEAQGIEVLGPTWHGIFRSIYFFDPNGHRLELAADTATDEQMKKLDAVKWDMLDEWDRTKRAPKHAAWMHDKEFQTQ